MKKKTISIYFESKSQLCSKHKKAHVILGQMYKISTMARLRLQKHFLEHKG